LPGLVIGDQPPGFQWHGRQALHEVLLPDNTVCLIKGNIQVFTLPVMVYPQHDIGAQIFVDRDRALRGGLQSVYYRS
jgi:hypothetical protein